MADIVDRATRSRMMSAIRGKNTRPETLVRRHLHRSGLRFRIHDSRLPGRPDIVLARFRTAVFVHGCFWHQHPGCRYAVKPTSNVAFWSEKLSRNVTRDAANRARLERDGWHVITIWECEASAARHLDSLVARIRACLAPNDLVK